MPSGAALASELEVAHYQSVADLLRSSHKPDAAVICTPNHTHVAVAKELSSGGVHLLIEKPLSTNESCAKELLEHLKGNSVRTLVGHHRRFNPYMVATKQILDAGALGHVIAISGLWATYKPLDYFDPPTEWHRSGTGGVILINMIHEIDLLHYLFGPIARVHAEKTISQRGYEAEEGAALTVRFATGVVGTLIISDNAPSPHNFESGTGENPLIPKSGKDFYRIFGSEASLSVPDMTLSSYNGKSKTWHQEMVQESVPVEDGVPFELQLAHFIKVMRGEEAPSCTVRAGLAAVAVCSAIKKAVDANATVEIEPYEL